VAHGRKFYGVQRALSATNRGAIDDLESFGIYSTKAINTFWAGGTNRVGFNCELFPQRFMALSLLIFNARGVVRIAHMALHDTKSFQPGAMRGSI